MEGESMSEWKEVRLGDIVTVKSGYAYKGKYISNKGKNILLGMGCVSYNDKFLYSGARAYDEDCDERYCAKAGDIVLATRQQSDSLPILAMPAIIPNSLFDKKIIVGTNLYLIKNDSDIDNHFLFWLLKTPNYVNYISSVKTGTTVRMVTKKDVENYIFKCPSKEERDTISNILWGIDAKIETNNKLNEKLEEMAQAIFKSWFVDFEPFKEQPFHESELGMIPEGWEVTTIGENLKTALGGTPSRNRDDYWNGEIAWINSGEINKFRIIQASEYITDNGLKSSATKLLPAKTTVLAITGATLGQVSLLEIDTCANQSVIGVLESDAIKHQFIYPLIKSQIKYLILHQTGGAQQHINKQNVDSIQFVLPPKDILDEYQIITKKIFDQISTLCFENQRLASLRDTLLPRLMSGEIKI